MHQWCHLLRDIRVVERAEVIGFARSNTLLQAIERRMPRTNASQTSSTLPQDDELGHHHAFDNSVASVERFPAFPQLGSAPADLRYPTLAPTCMPRAHFARGSHHLAVEVCQCWAPRYPQGSEVRFTRNRTATWAQYLVVNQSLSSVRIRSCASRVSVKDTVRWSNFTSGAMTRRCIQGAVVGLGRNALCDPPRECQAQRPEQQQWREHPVKDFPKQTALFTLEQPKRQFGVR